MSDNDDQKSESGLVFDLDLKDNDLISMIKKPLQESESYWNNTFKLEAVRKANMKMWMPNHWQDKEYYDYQEDYLYQDPRIFTSVETVVSIINARIPQPEVMPAQDTLISINAAKDIQRGLYAYVRKYRVLDYFKLSARNLLIKRIGFIKLRFDKTKGEHGEIVTEHVSPEDIIVDENAKFGDVPRFIAQKIRDKTVEELISMFPENENAILEMAGVSRRDGKGNLVAYKTQLAKKKTIYEVWLTYQVKGETVGATVWVDDQFQTVLGKMKNPNYNYEEDGESLSNLLDFPEPPFIPINYLNLGDSYIDQTSLIEQASSLQKTLDRRGFQIMENAEQSGSGLIFNTQMITKADIGKLTGSPDERIGVKGDVRAAMTRIPTPPLPQYVIEDKIDARNEIDNVFATHDVSRGEESGNKTLGQDMMQRDQDYTRMDDIARALERQASLYYRYLVQMMKVYYTEDHWFKMTGEDGQFDFVVMREDLIEDGVDISVEAGTMLPIDKSSQQKWVGDLMTAGLLDPLTIYEVAAGGDLPSPKKMLERFMNYTTDPMGFINKTREDDVSREAFLDIQIMIRQEVPAPRKEYAGTYFNFINEYMTTGDFENQSEMVKSIFIEHMNYARSVANKQLTMWMNRMPTEEEVEVQNQKAIVEAQDAAAMTEASAASAQPPTQGGEQPPAVAQPPAGGDQSAPIPPM